MKYYGKAIQTVGEILQAFDNPHTLPKPLATAFLSRSKDIPSAQWSWRNRFVLALKGITDARGFRQWGEVGRTVQKGAKAHYILAPCVAKQREDGDSEEEDKRIIYGFRAIPVFALEQTEGAELPPSQVVNHKFISALPLLAVAKEWGLTVKAIPSPAWKGQYVHGTEIRLAVENEAVWAHELCHAAEYRLGELKKGGQHWRSEIVAQLGGAVLLTMLGKPVEADLGGCKEYVKHYADKARLPLIEAVSKMIERTCSAVNLILDTADKLHKAQEDEKAQVKVMC